MRNAILLAATLLASSMSLGAANPAVAPQRPTPDMKADYLRMEAPQGTFPLRAPSDEGPYDNPEGEKKAYVRSCTSIAPVLWFMAQTEIEGAVGYAVFGDDNTVYLSPMVNNILGLGYIKGTIDAENIITFQFPQYMGSLGDGTRLDLYCMEDLGTDEYGWSNGAKVIEDQTYKMKLADDGSIAPLPEYALTILGWSPDEGKNFGGYGDCNYLFVPQTDEVVTPTEAALANSKPCSWGNGSVGFIGQMAADGNDLYVQGMFPLMPESWVKCEKAGEGYYFPSGQLLGAYDPGHSHQYWSYGYAVDSEMVYIPDLESEMPYMTYLDGLELKPVGDKAYQANAGTYDNIKTDIGGTYLSFDEGSGECVLSEREAVEMLLTPQAPDIRNYNIFESGDGVNVSYLSYAFFALPQYSEDDVLINPDNLFYEVFIDGEPFKFTHEEYPAIPEEGWTLIPYDFSDGMDRINSNTGYWSDIHEFIISGNYSRVGIRSVCKVGDQYRYSDIVYAVPEGVEETLETASPVVSETIVNLAGVKVSNPGPGIYVRTTRHADGTVRTQKVCL